VRFLDASNPLSQTGWGEGFFGRRPQHALMLSIEGAIV
jgi:hypothetical protein